MSEFIWILIWIGFVAIVARSVNVTKSEVVLGVQEERWYWIIAFLAFLPVLIMAGNRSYGIGDTFAYKQSFLAMPDTLDGMADYMAKNTKDAGFYFFSSLIKIYISDDPRVWLWIIAIIQSLLLVSFFRKYSSSYIISYFLFVVSGEYISWMFNGMRQFLAVTIVLLAVPFIAKKKYIRAILIVLLASTIHQTALLMIPIMFVVQGEAWNKKTVIYVLLIMAAVLFINQFTDFLEESLAGTQYSNVVAEYKELKDNGTSFLRVLVFSVPTIMSLIFRDKINARGNKFVMLSVNMSVASTGIYIVSMLTSGIFIGRLPIYCSLFNYLLLPWMLREMFDISIRTIVYTVMVMFYLVFYWFQMGVTWGMI